MAARAEIAIEYAKEYSTGGKRERGRILDRVVEVTGWSRDNARRRLVAAARPDSGCSGAKRPRKPRRRRYSSEAIEVLETVWLDAGGQCGKYLAASMSLHLSGLERHGVLVPGQGNYSAGVRAELLAMSAATIDRYLAPARAADTVKDKSPAKQSPSVRPSIKSSGDGCDSDPEPGRFRGEIVAHGGSTPGGDFAYTLHLTDVHIGWTFIRTMRNIRTDLLSVLNAAASHIPYGIARLDLDMEREWLDQTVIDWAYQRSVVLACSQHHKPHDLASAAGHFVARYALSYRYDTEPERVALNRLWRNVNDRVNYLTPNRRPIGYGVTRHGRRTRVYDKPATPLDRLLAAGILSATQQAELLAYRSSVNPAAIAREIAAIQGVLSQLASNTTANDQPGPAEAPALEPRQNL